MSQSNALVVDASPSVRNYVRDILQELRFNEIHEGEDADDALQILNSGYAIDWIFSSWEMPGRSTRKLLKTIRGNPNCTRTHFILMSAEDEHVVRNIAIQEGVADYLCKPFTHHQMVHMVHRLKGLVERRGAERFKVEIPCEIDIGFDSFHRYGAEVVDISLTGCRLITSEVKPGSGYVDDYATITLLTENGDPLQVYAKIRRLEFNQHSTDPLSNTEIAVEFISVVPQLHEQLAAFVNSCKARSAIL